ncbi:hypothetical protein Golomagni_07169, partial [Golovinomyces magnicellulatus]
MSDGDSPFSITANVAGLLTFVVAITATIYARLSYLRNGDEEYIRVKTSLSWYKTESQWLSDLVAALGAQQDEKHEGHIKSTEYQMYSFVMDDLINLEHRLLDIVVDIEAKASSDAAANRAWTIVLSSGRPSVAVAWLAVRSKAMELVRQREALTARVQFLQMSMMSSRLRDLENRFNVADKNTAAMLEMQVMDLKKVDLRMRKLVPDDTMDGDTRVN